MSEQISEAAWERAFEKRISLDCVYRTLKNGPRLYQLGDDEYDVTRDEALAAQAELDADAVTDAEIEAAAQAIYVSLNLTCSGDDKSFGWDDASESFKEHLRKEAKAILEAASKARRT